MKRFLLSQFPDESERSSNIVRGDVILALDFLERHAPSQAPHHDCDRYAGAANDGFAVGDGRIENNAVRGGHGVSNDSDLAELVEWNHQDRVSTPAGAKSLISDLGGGLRPGRHRREQRSHLHASQAVHLDRPRETRGATINAAFRGQFVRFVAHQTGRIQGLTTADLRAMLAAFEKLRAHFKGLIEANIASWETDDAKTNR